ncbi:MAG: CBS domain-containing protein [Candidatus Micrarchaeota archaeon]|nr:CBS domain-containing protein [Candidatus Micrarchaeota archaeon]
MDIRNILLDPVVTEAETPLSKAISAMIENEKSDALVFRDDEFAGVVSAKDILRKQVGNPDKVKIETLARKVYVGDEAKTIEELAGMMLAGDYSEMPFATDEGMKVLPKHVLITLLDKDTLSRRKAEDIMNVPYFVSEDDNLPTVKKMLFDLNVSKIPVVDDTNKVIGLVDMLNLLKTVTKRERAAAGELSGEKKGTEGVKVSSFMSRDVLVVLHTETADSVASKMAKRATTCALVERDGMLAGIITPKDILKLVGKEEKGIYMNLSGYLPDDEFEAEQIKDIAKRSLEKLEKMVRITYAVMHIEKHEKGAVKSLYTVSARLGTHVGLFRADHTDWDIVATVRKTLDKIEKAVDKDLDKRKTLKRMKA